MIKLGLRGIQAKPAEISAIVLRALSDTVRWCSLRQSESFLFRSPDIDPSRILKPPPFPNERTEIEIWIQERYRSFETAVSELNRQRSDLICGMSIPTVDSDQAVYSQGRLLLYFPMETVTDGAAEAVSHGFFDGEDAPPWDTWFWYSNGAILCWIPESKAATVQAGIDANPVDCIHWADWRDLSRLTN
jgi:hypothetical protein